MIHPDTELKFINEKVGYGIVAKKFIPKGTITWVLDDLDQKFTPLQVEKFDDIYKEILDKYSYRNPEGNLILCWDTAKYINHSFKSNCITTSYEFEIAVRDIYAGKELTDDYGYLNISEPFEPMDEGTERKIVFPDDILRFYNVWDEQVKQALPLINSLDQPLKNFIKQKTWKKIMKVVEGREDMQSILSCYYNPEKRIKKLA